MNCYHTVRHGQYWQLINCIVSFWSKKLHSGPDLQKNCIQSLIYCSGPGNSTGTILYPCLIALVEKWTSAQQKRRIQTCGKNLWKSRQVQSRKRTGIELKTEISLASINKLANWSHRQLNM